MCTENTICLSQMCNYRKACRCTCEGWFSDPLLQGQCKGACYDNPNLRHDSKENYVASLCGTSIGAMELYNKTGFICPDFDPLDDSEQGRKYTRDKDKDETDKAAAAEAMKKQIIFFLVIVGILGFLIFMSKR